MLTLSSGSETQTPYSITLPPVWTVRSHVGVFMSSGLTGQCPWTWQNKPGFLAVCCGVNHPPNLSGLKTTQGHFSLLLPMNSASCCPSSRIQLPGQPFSGGLPIFRRKAKENMGNAPSLFKFPPESDTSSQSHVIGQSKSFGHIKLHGAREGQFCHMPPSRPQVPLPFPKLPSGWNIHAQSNFCSCTVTLGSTYSCMALGKLFSNST